MHKLKTFFNRLFKEISAKSKPNFWQAKVSAILLIIMACGPGPADYNEFLSYFMPEASNAPPVDARYHYTPAHLYVQDYDDTLYDNQTINAMAWADYTKGKLSAKTVSNYFYWDKTEGQKRDNALANALKTNTEASTYLKFADAIDQANMPTENEWEIPQKDSLKMLAFLDNAQRIYPKIKDSFIKERYAFQAVKLAEIVKNHKKAIELYEKLVLPLPKKTFISIWAKSRYAGALLLSDQKAQAFYHFAQVFDQCPSRRKEADASIRVWGLGYQEKALEYCKNNAEKASVYALGAIQPSVEGLPLLEKIIEESPQNALAELIMAREINKNELFYFKQNRSEVYSSEADFEAKSETQAGSYFEKLGAFAEKCGQNSTLKNQAFWQTAGAYIAFTLNDLDKAQVLLEKAKMLPNNNKILQEQIAMQDILLSAEKSPSISPALEIKAIDFFEKFGKSNSFRKINGVAKVSQLLVAKYLETSEAKPKPNESGWLASCSKAKEANVEGSPIVFAKAKAFLINSLASYQQVDGYAYSYISQHDQYATEDSTASATIQAVIDYYEQKSPSDFDIRLFKVLRINPNYLYTLLGRRALDEHQYQTAQKAFAKVQTFDNEGFIDNLDQNPFFVKPDNGQNKGSVITPLGFAQKMVTLEQQAKSGDANAWYLLGCGAYNSGYEGNAWILRRRERSTTETSFEYQEQSQLAKLDRDYYTSIKAKTYLEKSLQLSKNEELSAKIAYMLAVIERQEYSLLFAKNYPSYDTENFKDKEDAYFQKMADVKAEKFSTYFKMLKTKSAKTNYNALVLRECSTYKNFIDTQNEDRD